MNLVSALFVSACLVVGLPKTSRAQESPAPDTKEIVLAVPPADLIRLLPSPPESWKLTTSSARSEITPRSALQTTATRDYLQVTSASGEKADGEPVPPKKTRITLLDTGFDPTGFFAFQNFKPDSVGPSGAKRYLMGDMRVVEAVHENKRIFAVAVSNRFLVVLTVENQDEKEGAEWLERCDLSALLAASQRAAQLKIPEGALPVAFIDELHPETNQALETPYLTKKEEETRQKEYDKWAASQNMIGEQSQNEGILVVPAPGKVVIDGAVSEWDWSGRVWMFADVSVRDRYSAEVAAMWDKENLYLAAKWKDPTPMFSTRNPAINPDDGWKSDAWQMRLRTDRTMWLTSWYYTAQKQPAISMEVWKNPKDVRGGLDKSVLMAKPGGTELGEGVEMAYQADADGKGFVQEIKIPWKVLYKQVPEIQAGLALQLGCEFQWGDVTGGNAAPIHRYTDNMQTGSTSRMFYWTNQSAWGDARLVGEGKLPLREYGESAALAAQIEGSVPVRLSLPDSATRFTVAINDAQGQRIRNLGGDLDPKRYKVEEKDGQRIVEILWDGLDDAGKLVNPGKYRVAGLSHDGLNAKYEMCFYNPGTPAWATADGTGAWGADHSGPGSVAAAGDWMVLGFPFAEGGSGTIGISPEGLKKWGEKRGALKVAGNKDDVFAVIGQTMNNSSAVPRLCRYSKADGSYRPFVVGGQTLPFELPMNDIFGPGRHGPVTALAVGSDRIAAGVGAPAPQVPTTLELWVEAKPNGPKPREAWTLEVDDFRFTQEGNPAELIGPSFGNGDFEKGNPDFYGYLTKEVKVETAAPDRPAASGTKFLAMTIDAKPGANGHRAIKQIKMPDFSKGGHFVLTAKVRAREADGINQATVSATFLDQSRGVCGVYRAEPVAVTKDGWTEIKLDFTFELPKQKQTVTLAFADVQTAAPVGRFEVPSVTALAYAPDGKLYGIVGGKVSAIDETAKTVTPISLPQIGNPVALAIDGDGNLVVADNGADSQVKAFSPQGKLAYTCGKKGGRPIRGAFDKEAMMRMSSVAVDSKGQVWVVEDWDYPRRVSVWGRDGKLVRDYIGNANYSGMGTYLHDQDPTRAYCGAVEMKLDKASRTWKVSQILWVPDRSKGETFEVSPAGFANPKRFTSSASGKPHEYLFTLPSDASTGMVLFTERKDGWKPVAAIGKVSHLSGRLNNQGKIEALPSGELEGVDPNKGVYWNDANRDGKVQRSECSFTDKPLPSSSGWGGKPGADLTLYAYDGEAVVAYRPTGFDPEGAPRYGPEGMTRISTDGRRKIGVNGDLVPVTSEGRLLLANVGRNDKSAAVLGIGGSEPAVEWTYPDPFPGVHGSHKATMPKPGLLMSPLKICGVAQVDEKIGNVFLMRGNLGQDFLMTTDGLYIGALFEDGRLPGDILPSTEEALLRRSMDHFSNGDEPFNGWFGKQADGKIRLTTGMAREAGMILQVTGLETIRRFKGENLTLDEAKLAAAAADNVSRAVVSASASENRYTVRKVPGAPTHDGTPGSWNQLPGMDATREGQPDKAAVQLAYDDANLYARFVVKDASPWKNEGKEYSRLFKTGDAVDIQIGLQPDAKGHPSPQAGDVRVVISQLAGQPVAVLMAPVDPAAPESSSKTYTSPVGTKGFARVEVLKGGKVAVKQDATGYVVEATIPWQQLGGKSPTAGTTLRGDVGFISSDPQGLRNVSRTYWSDKNTNLVSDEPLEAWFTPGNWGEWKFE